MTGASTISDSLDILEHLETSVTPVAGIEELLTSTKRAFLLIEPWCQAKSRSDNSAVKDIVTQIRQCTGVYLDAIDMSLRTSESGVLFAEDASALCGLLSRGGVPPEHFIAFLDDMISLSEKAYHNAQQATGKFRSARQGFFQITNHIGYSVVKVHEELEHTKKSKRRYEKTSALAELVHTNATKAAEFLDSSSGLLATCVPLPVSIILPIVLALVVLAAKGGGDKLQQTAKDRAMREISCEDAIVELHEINSDLDELLGYVTIFADWWSNITGKLVTLRDSTSRLDSSRSDGFNRLGSIQERWVDVKNQYRSYAQEISKLQDFYPNIPRESSPQNVGLTENVPVPVMSHGSPIDLASTIHSVTDHVETCRNAFRDLQVASMHVNRKNSLKMHECLEDIKMKLIAEWEIFPHYLHQVLCFREEIELQPLESATSKDFAAKAMDTLQRTINSNSDSREALNRHKSSMVTVLLSTKSRKGLDRPCGSEALRTLERSLAEVGLRLSDSMEFWHAICQTSSDGSTGLEGVTVWQADHSIIQSSITSISKSCDTLSMIFFTKSPASGGKKSRGARYRLKSSGK